MRENVLYFQIMCPAMCYKTSRTESQPLEYKEILESTIALNSWIGVSTDMLCIPQESEKLTYFFCLELQLVYAITLLHGSIRSDCSAGTQVDVKTENLLKRRYVRSQRFGCSLMAVSSGKDR